MILVDVSVLSMLEWVCDIVVCHLVISLLQTSFSVVDYVIPYRFILNRINTLNKIYINDEVKQQIVISYGG